VAAQAVVGVQLFAGQVRRGGGLLGLLDLVGQDVQGDVVQLLVGERAAALATERLHRRSGPPDLERPDDELLDVGDVPVVGVTGDDVGQVGSGPLALGVVWRGCGAPTEVAAVALRAVLHIQGLAGDDLRHEARLDSPGGAALLADPVHGEEHREEQGQDDAPGHVPLEDAALQLLVRVAGAHAWRHVLRRAALA
jgi:hypothetical protein